MQPDEWHAWFVTQAQWTRPTRTWLYRQVGLDRATTVLEVGCGSGVISAELAALQTAYVVGLDIQSRLLAIAAARTEPVTYLQGDAHTLPFPAAAFDAVVCHYLLMWLSDPARAVREMVRVTRPGGCVLACAEPDYGGRIDHPPDLIPLGQLQMAALRRQGADPTMGRRLGSLFTAAGLQTTVGVIGGQWECPSSIGDDFQAEWTMRRYDLAGWMSPRELDRLYDVDRQARLAGRRVLFVPTFYAWGVVP